MKKLRIVGILPCLVLGVACINVPEDSGHILSPEAHSICIKDSIGVIASDKSMVDFSGNATINGDYLAIFAQTQASGNAVIMGKAYVSDASLLTLNGNASAPSVQTGDFSSDQELIDEFSSELSNLTPNQTLDSLGSSESFQGNGGLNVVEISGSINLSGNQGVVISGGPNDIFVFNVRGSINVSGNATIAVQGGMREQNIVWNNPGGGDALNLVGNGVISGTFMGTERAAQVAGNGELRGALIAGDGINVAGNGLVINPYPFCITAPNSPNPGPSASPSAGPSSSPSPTSSPAPAASPSPSPSPSASPSPAPSPSPSSSPCTSLVCGGGILGS